MGKWKYEYDGSEYHILHGTTWKRGVAFKSRTAADVLINSHNADVDAYEARIAELEAEVAAARKEGQRVQLLLADRTAELARVKAESLRVVREADDGIRLERWEADE